MSVREDPSSVRLRDVLLEMRRGRMGLIQTADQLRFSYLAAIQGARCIMGDGALQASPLPSLCAVWGEGHTLVQDKEVPLHLADAFIQSNLQ